MEDLDTARARTVSALLQERGQPGIDLAAAHVAQCALHREWPVVTDEPGPLLALDPTVPLESMS